MHARNALKIKKHNKATMEARILKLNLEEQRSKTRIREAERRASFVADMNNFK